ncbi:hypothetical protein D3C75_1064990 [compost metagenome]
MGAETLCLQVPGGGQHGPGKQPLARQRFKALGLAAQLRQILVTSLGGGENKRRRTRQFSLGQFDFGDGLQRLSDLLHRRFGVFIAPLLEIAGQHRAT